MRFNFAIAAYVAASVPLAANAASLTGSSPGFHYFYKQGADITAHDEALVDCAVKLRAMLNGSDATTALAASTGGGLVGALIGGVIDSNENRQGDAANIEGCMAIKGWSVVALTRDDGERMEQPDDPAAIHEKLRPYIEAPSPRGTILRGPFANEIAAGDFVIGVARDLEEVSLSVRATKDQRENAVDAAGPLKPAKPDLPKGVKAPKPVKAIKAETLASADASASYIVMRISNVHGAMALFDVMFNRLAADGSELIYDGAATVARTGLAKTGKGKNGDEKYHDFVMPVPPGMWKLSAFTAPPYAADFCFGAPAFSVGEGEVLFVGEMTIRDEGGYPINPAMDIAQEILAGSPSLFTKAKPAEWTNGYASECFGSYAYAYEIPGAPFVDQGALRSAARAQPDTIASETPPEE